MEQSGGLGGRGDRGGPGLFDSFEERFELVIAILLGLAAIAAAFAAYKTDLRDGDALKYFQEGNRTADKASRAQTKVVTQRNEDQIVTTFALQSIISAEFAASSTGTEISTKESKDLGNTLINLVGSPELKKANAECEKDQECQEKAIPPVDSKFYVVPEAAQAKQLDAQADSEFRRANANDKKGDKYSLVTVFLATALFLYGVAAVGRGRTVKLGMASLGGLIFVVSVVMLITV